MKPNDQELKAAAAAKEAARIAWQEQFNTLGEDEMSGEPEQFGRRHVEDAGVACFHEGIQYERANPPELPVEALLTKFAEWLERETYIEGNGYALTEQIGSRYPTEYSTEQIVSMFLANNGIMKLGGNDRHK